MKTLEMQDIRHLNLFAKVTNIRTRFSFPYNGTIIFCVPKHMLYKAIGGNARNIKKMNEILGKRIRIIPMPQGLHHLRPFIESIITPTTFKDLEIKNNEIIIKAGKKNKAALIGRNKRRLLELQKIVKDFFGKDLRIV